MAMLRSLLDLADRRVGLIKKIKGFVRNFDIQLAKNNWKID